MKFDISLDCDTIKDNDSNWYFPKILTNISNCLFEESQSDSCLREYINQNKIKIFYVGDFCGRSANPKDNHTNLLKRFDILKINLVSQESVKNKIPQEKKYLPRLIFIEIFDQDMSQEDYEMIKKLNYHRFFKSDNNKKQGFIHVSSLRLNKFGVCYVAFNDMSLKEAIISANSLKAVSKTETMIFTDLIGVENIDCFDYHYAPNELEQTEIKRLIDDRHRWESIKLLFLNKTIFHETLFLDADTYINKDPSNYISEMLKDNDLLLTNGPEVEMEYTTTSDITARPIVKKVKALTGKGIQLSVFAIKMSPAMQQFIEYWKYSFIESSTQYPNSGSWGSDGVNEQKTLNSILNKKIHELLCINLKFIDNCLYNASLKTWNPLYQQNRWNNCFIIHSHAIKQCLDQKIEFNNWPLSKAATKFKFEINE